MICAVRGVLPSMGSFRVGTGPQPALRALGQGASKELLLRGPKAASEYADYLGFQAAELNHPFARRTMAVISSYASGGYRTAIQDVCARQKTPQRSVADAEHPRCPAAADLTGQHARP